MKFSGKVGSGPINKLLNFGGDSNRDACKTCLGGGMHCPIASSYAIVQFARDLTFKHVTGNVPVLLPNTATSEKINPWTSALE